MRKITTGKVGAPILGDLTVVGSEIQSIPSGGNISIDPNGAGLLQINANVEIQDNQGLRLLEASGNGTNYVTLQAPSSLGGNVTLTLPTTDGDANQALITNGSGVLSFSDVVTTVSNQVADTGRYFVLIADDALAGSGSLTELNYSDNKLEYQPSSGTLYVTNVEATNITASGNLQGNAITETSSIALKENLTPIENALDSIVKLAGKIYDRKDGSSKNEPGLIAEEVEEIIPNIVTKDVNGNPESIAYTRLGVYIVEAIKTLKSEIDDLKRR